MKENDTYCTTLYTDEELKKIVSPDQYRVIKLNGTEFPFANRYWNNKDKGIYVDVVSGVPLFASIHKYDSGTGWPSFFRPITDDALVYKKDFDLGYERIEVRSKADSHLGHMFDDGPKPTGKRYCINSASLRFVPFERMIQEGYSDFLYLFDEQFPAV